jgi:hypothetical protein
MCTCSHSENTTHRARNASLKAARVKYSTSRSGLAWCGADTVAPTASSRTNPAWEGGHQGKSRSGVD